MRGRIVSREVDLAREPDALFEAVARAAPGGEGEGVSFLDSSLVHERFGRRSILAWSPAEVLSCKGRRGTLRSRDGEAELAGSPFDLLRDRLRARRIDGAASGVSASPAGASAAP